mmetsp:Transcript_644/g.2349  ORF Transcript_644/g.2349 Transcript_644/m.2349 type:complete len:240 (-) Transcript_644:380-1099(-)
MQVARDHEQKRPDDGCVVLRIAERTPKDAFARDVARYERSRRHHRFTEQLQPLVTDVREDRVHHHFAKEQAEDPKHHPRMRLHGIDPEPDARAERGERPELGNRLAERHLPRRGLVHLDDVVQTRVRSHDRGDEHDKVVVLVAANKIPLPQPKAVSERGGEQVQEHHYDETLRGPVECWQVHPAHVQRLPRRKHEGPRGVLPQEQRPPTRPRLQHQRKRQRPNRAVHRVAPVVEEQAQR